MKITIISILVAVALIGGAFFLTKGDNDATSNEPVSNVTVVDGKQIIEIDAKGGYSPKITTAKADMPTVIRVATKGTFDCSSSLTIPAVGYRGNLRPSDVTEIEIPSQKAGETLQGVCSMGMYSFAVNFN